MYVKIILKVQLATGAIGMKPKRYEMQKSLHPQLIVIFPQQVKWSSAYEISQLR